MIIGVGQDIVHVPRLAAALDRWGRRFRERVFTPEERAYCDRFRYPAQHFAARFAAKEAFYKAMSRGRPLPLAFLDAGVRAGETGIELVLSEKARRLADEQGVRTAHVSLSHDGEYASAIVILEG